MAKKIIQNLFPNLHKLRKHPRLYRIFGDILKRQNLWHINRRSVSRGVAIGLFWAFIPMPMQMVPATLCAIVARANVAISIVFVWVSNPFTIPPIFYFCYKVGSLLLGIRNDDFHFEFSWEWLQNSLLGVWQPFLLGCFVVGVLASILGYVVVNLYWRYYTVSYWRKRVSLKQK